MRIDRLELRNFKTFAALDLDLHPQFTLLIGENGAGKTSVLDALAVALGIWLVEPPDSTLMNSRRGIDPSEIRLESHRHGDRELFSAASGGVSVKARGQIVGREDLVWERRIEPGKRKATNAGAREALAVVQAAYERAGAEERVLLPVIAYYGAGCAWLPHRERPRSRSAASGRAPMGRFLRLPERAHPDRRPGRLVSERGHRGREPRRPVSSGIRGRPPGGPRMRPGADGMWFDGDRSEIVLSIEGRAQPFTNLSAGQRMMLALVADIAIKAVTQNNHLVPEIDPAPTNGAPPDVLAQTPGVVLIDELDVHLHPRWQRRVASDLKSTFPKIPFVCVSVHRPHRKRSRRERRRRRPERATSGRAQASSIPRTRPGAVE